VPVCVSILSYFGIKFIVLTNRLASILTWVNRFLERRASTFLSPIVAGWIGRIVSASCGLLNTRLLIDLMGIQNFGSITIVLSLLPWFAFLNLGLPNSVQNAISRMRVASQDVTALKQISVNAAFFIAVALTPAALIFAFLIQHLLLKGHDATQYAWISVICVAMIFNGFSQVFNHVLYGMHRSFWPVVAPAIQAAMTTLALTLAIVLHARNPIWGAVAVALPIMTLFAFSARLVGARPRLSIDWMHLRGILKEGRGFLVFGLAAQVTLACDYIVMAFLLSNQNIVEYNLVSKIFGVILTLHSVLMATSWTPMSDRYHRGDFVALRRDVKHLLLIGYSLAIGVALPMIIFMSDVTSILSGSRVLTVPFSLVASWFGYIIVRVWSDTFATALLSFNELSTMNGYIFWQAAISLPAQWFLGVEFGSTGIVLGIIISFIVTAAWVLPWKFAELTRARIDTQNIDQRFSDLGM